MSDLISKQATIDTEGLYDQIRCEMCRNPMHTHRGCDGNCKYDEKLYERIMQILDERIKPLPSEQPEPKWIPCSERLPEKYGWYMCTLKDYRVNTYYWNNKGEWIDNGKKHFFELYNISSRYTGEDITAEQEGSVYWTDWVIAWMPLPEPWKEGENE